MIELEISDAAVDAADIFGGQVLDGDLREQLDRAAPLIVAAELRRLAGWLACDDGTREDLRDRADELDPQGGQS